MYRYIPEYLDAFYTCLDSCIDCISQMMSPLDLREMIDEYYVNNELTDSQYNALMSVLKEIQ